MLAEHAAAVGAGLTAGDDVAGPVGPPAEAFDDGACCVPDDVLDGAELVAPPDRDGLTTGPTCAHVSADPPSNTQVAAQLCTVARFRPTIEGAQRCDLGCNGIRE